MNKRIIATLCSSYAMAMTANPGKRQPKALAQVNNQGILEYFDGWFSNVGHGVSDGIETIADEILDFGGSVDDSFDSYDDEAEDQLGEVDGFHIDTVKGGIEGGSINLGDEKAAGWDDYLDWGEGFGEDFVDVFEDDIPKFADSGINGKEDYFDDAGHWIIDAPGNFGGTAEDLFDELGDFGDDVCDAI